MLRIDKYLADCGIGTRSEVKTYIKHKQVTVNGVVITKPDIKVDEMVDVVYWNGKKAVYEKYVYYVFHKPAGCVTAKKDTLHKTVMDYFPEALQKILSPVGRLDFDTEGLLLLTNDGELAHHLLSPAHHIPKTYYVCLDKPIPKEAVLLFQKGIDIGEKKCTLPAELTILEPDSANLPGSSTHFAAKLTIHEGRFHQVKRMFHAIGCEVTYLKRLSMGNLELGELPIGTYQKLNKQDIL